MQIVTREQGIFVRKPEGTSVTYHVFPEYELDHNVVDPGTVQPWHHHTAIEETLFIISGQLEARWISDGHMSATILHEGDIARVEDSPHTFVNSSSQPATFLVVRLVLTGEDKREIIRSDKRLDCVE